jgi:DNA-binding transcriptional ArsR family regulator
LPQEAKQEALMITLSESAKPIDNIFRALSDPTRRHVLERLSRSPASVSELAAPFDMALPSFVQHMGILEDCGLVQSRKAGRVRTYQLVPKRLKLAEDWMVRQRALWEKRVDQLDTYLITLKEK